LAIAVDVINLLGTAATALMAAVIGGLFVLVGTNRTLTSTSKEAAAQRDADRRAADTQYERELLSRGADRLLDALWTKERELCAALNTCREQVTAGVEPSTSDPALVELGRLDLAVYQDMIVSLPFVHDAEPRERLRSAAQMVNDCYNLRGGSTPDTVKGGTVESIGRAMIEVQAYFKWLRWNLVCALRGDPLPPAVEMPKVRRAEGGTGWTIPPGVPPWT
jgi:hypothetical protein